MILHSDGKLRFNNLARDCRVSKIGNLLMEVLCLKTDNFIDVNQTKPFEDIELSYVGNDDLMSAL